MWKIQSFPYTSKSEKLWKLFLKIIRQMKLPFKLNKSGLVPIKIISECIQRLNAFLDVRIAKGKVFYFGHLCQLLLHAVIFSKGKCICKSGVSTTGLKSDKLGTADTALSALCLPGPLNIRILWRVFPTYLILYKPYCLLRIWSTNLLAISKFAPTLLRDQALPLQEGKEESLMNWFCPFIAPRLSNLSSEVTSSLVSVLLRMLW